jgi:hypothetical protein
VERADLDVLRDAFVADFPREGEDAARAFLFGVIAHQRGFEGERLWIDTTPLNIANADRIARLLPTARFVHMVRDGRSTAVSITRQRWGPDEALRWWADRMRHAWQGARALPAGSLLTLHLEDLVVRRREETLQSLLDFFELREARRMRTFFDTRMPAERVDLLGWRTAVPDPAAFDVEYHRLVDALVRDGVPRELVADASREA